MSQVHRSTDGVVLLHGIARTSVSMRVMQRALEAAGYPVLNLDYRSRHLPLDALAEAIHPSVSRFAAAMPGAVNVVAHSMGGLLARAYLARHRPARLGRAVMLGTPNGGSEIADLLRAWPLYRAVFGPAGQQLVTAQGAELLNLFGTVDYEVGIVAGSRPMNPLAAAWLLPGPNDGKVSLASTRLAGMADHLVIPTSHTRLASHPEAVAAALRFLRGGAFGAALTELVPLVSVGRARAGCAPGCGDAG